MRSIERELAAARKLIAHLEEQAGVKTAAIGVSSVSIGFSLQALGVLVIGLPATGPLTLLGFGTSATIFAIVKKLQRMADNSQRRKIIQAFVEQMNASGFSPEEIDLFVREIG